MRKIIVLLGLLLSSNVFAHTGFHNDIVHPLSGVDHFTVILMFGVFAGIAYYWFNRNDK